MMDQPHSIQITQCLCEGFEEGAQIAETEGEAAGPWSDNKGCDWIVKHLIERLNMQPLTIVGIKTFKDRIGEFHIKAGKFGNKSHSQCL